MKTDSIIWEEIRIYEQQKLEEVLSIIHIHHRNIPNMDALESLVDINGTECSRLFRKYLKITPMEYIRRYRIETACQLLASTDMSVTEISVQCGMNASYLSKKVREITGVTPLAYRRHYIRERNKNNFQE